jgi:REP element-mobilizing transposase RayT
MHAYIGGICKQLNCPPIIIGGIGDHVHILCRLSRTITIADLLEEVKKSSSKWVKDRGGLLTGFAWQRGYAAFSVDYRSADTVREYVANQEAHHQKRRFQDEFRKLMADGGVAFDEKYVWD